MAVSANINPAADAPTTVVEEQLYCTLTGRPLTREEAYWAPPLVTAGELVSMTLRTLLRAPSMLGHVLLADQPNVPYAPEARALLAKRRSAEQVKLLVVLLVLMVIITAPIFWMAMR